MSAAPSTITWDQWSAEYLDQSEPVKHGNDTEDESFPRYWKGSVLSWTQIPQDEDLLERVPPLNITGNRLLVVRNDEREETVYSVGGLSHASRTGGPRDDSLDKDINLFKIALNTGSYTWERVIPTAVEGCEIPQGRYGHSCAYYKGRIYMYGGRTAVRYSVFGGQGSIHCYDIKEGTWSELPTLVQDCDYPQPRYGHACTVHKHIMYIQGGHVLYTANRWGFTSELLSFNMDTNTWSLETPHYMKHPPPGQINAAIGKPENYLFLHRDFHVAFYFNGKIVIYGGRSPGFIISFDLYEFNIATKKWKHISPRGYIPGQRNHIAAEQIGCFMVCHGGELTHMWKDSFCEDTFVIDMRTYHCTKLDLYGSVRGRCNTASCVLSNGDMMLYGGESMATREEQDVASRSQHRLVYHNDVLILSLLPSLQLLCFDAIKSNGIDFSPLPPRLKQKIAEYI